MFLGIDNYFVTFKNLLGKRLRNVVRNPPASSLDLTSAKANFELYDLGFKASRSANRLFGRFELAIVPLFVESF